MEFIIECKDCFASPYECERCGGRFVIKSLKKDDPVRKLENDLSNARSDNSKLLSRLIQLESKLKEVEESFRNVTLNVTDKEKIITIKQDSYD